MNIGTTIKIAYLPGISVNLKSFLKSSVNPSMSSPDEDTHQYHINFIFEQIEGLNFHLLLKDKEILDYLNENGFEYIEI